MDFIICRVNGVQLLTKWCVNGDGGCGDGGMMLMMTVVVVVVMVVVMVDEAMMVMVRVFCVCVRCWRQ